MRKIGFVSSRGIGDISIALPIAHHYYTRDNEIYWPICEEFYPSFAEAAPWVNWIKIPTDAHGRFFIEEPTIQLNKVNVDETIVLYQALNVMPELSNVPWFQIQKFDEFKYTKAGVPFINKWKLANCITRNQAREDYLYKKVVKQDLYFVTHTKGSSFSFEPDLSGVPPEWQHIEISELTDNVFDWLKIIEGAQAVIMLDSAYANIVDQLQIPVDKYWIPRSHIHLTPVLGCDWTILEPPIGSGAAQRIFGAG